jgi:hypothetical protein
LIQTRHLQGKKEAGRTIAFRDSNKAADFFDGLLCCLLEG